jgi:acetyl/propionyl-CoA carboxylase alpha subunit
VDARPTDQGFSIVSRLDGRVTDAAVTEYSDGAWLVQLPHLDLDAIVDGRRRRPDRGSGSAGAGEERVTALTAPRDGRVREVHVTPGASVEAGRVLVVLD